MATKKTSTARSPMCKCGQPRDQHEGGVGASFVTSRSPLYDADDPDGAPCLRYRGRGSQAPNTPPVKARTVDSDARAADADLSVAFADLRETINRALDTFANREIEAKNTANLRALGLARTTKPFARARDIDLDAADAQPKAMPLPGANALAAFTLGKGERAVLTVLAQYRAGATSNQIAILTGYKRSTRNAYLQRLREQSFASANGDLHFVTSLGLEALGDYKKLPTGAALYYHWIKELPAGESEILTLLWDSASSTMTADDIGERTGFARSTRNTYLQRLGARRLIERNGSSVTLAKELLG